MKILSNLFNIVTRIEKKLRNKKYYVNRFSEISSLFKISKMFYQAGCPCVRDSKIFYPRELCSAESVSHADNVI